MAGREQTEKFLRALEERLDCSPIAWSADHAALAFEDGQRASLRFLAETGKMEIVTPIAGARQNLQRATLLKLLARNNPGGALAGGTIRVGPLGELEIHNVLPMAFEPPILAEILINQARIASQLADEA